MGLSARPITTLRHCGTDDTALVATMIAICDEVEPTAIAGLAPSCAIAA